MYAGDIWLANRDGSQPIRLTVHPGFEQDPYFSPDGKWIAFTGNYDGNTDVYMCPCRAAIRSASRGIPRATW